MIPKSGYRFSDKITPSEKLLRSLHGADFVGAGLHGRGDQQIDAHPGALDLGRERVGKPALQRPDQRFAHHLVVTIPDAVAGVARAEAVWIAEGFPLDRKSLDAIINHTLGG